MKKCLFFLQIVYPTERNSCSGRVSQVIIILTYLSIYFSLFRFISTFFYDKAMSVLIKDFRLICKYKILRANFVFALEFCGENVEEYDILGNLSFTK